MVMTDLWTNFNVDMFINSALVTLTSKVNFWGKKIQSGRRESWFSSSSEYFNMKWSCN